MPTSILQGQHQSYKANISYPLGILLTRKNWQKLTQNTLRRLNLASNFTTWSWCNYINLWACRAPKLFCFENGTGRNKKAILLLLILRKRVILSHFLLASVFTITLRFNILTGHAESFVFCNCMWEFHCCRCDCKDELIFNMITALFLLYYLGKKVIIKVPKNI